MTPKETLPTLFVLFFCQMHEKSIKMWGSLECGFSMGRDLEQGGYYGFYWKMLVD